RRAGVEAVDGSGPAEIDHVPGSFQTHARAGARRVGVIAAGRRNIRAPGPRARRFCAPASGADGGGVVSSVGDAARADQLYATRELDLVTDDDAADVEILVPVQAEGLAVDLAVDGVEGAHASALV